MPKRTKILITVAAVLILISIIVQLKTGGGKISLPESGNTRIGEANEKGK